MTVKITSVDQLDQLLTTLFPGMEVVEIDAMINLKASLKWGGSSSTNSCEAARSSCEKECQGGTDFKKRESRFPVLLKKLNPKLLQKKNWHCRSNKVCKRDEFLKWVK
jgi:hypothetical protein